MDLRSGPPPPPRGKRAVPTYQDNHRMEPPAGAGYHVPRRLGEREPDRNHNHPEDDATARAEFAPRNILADTPETTVGEHVHVKGELSFERLLRVDGSFKGTLTSTGDLVIGASGVIRGNISELREIVSDGKIIGNIQAERVRLRRSAVVVGSVTCLSLSMDPDVSISGRLNVHKDAPLKLHLEGEEAPEDELADSNESARLPDSNKSVDSEKHHSKSGGGSGRKEASSKKESSGADGERRPKEDKGKDESRKKTKEGGSGDSSKSKTSTK
ncbi:unnamed protein product [Laminaria digitata]